MLPPNYRNFLQRLRSSSQALQSWKRNCAALATELPLEFIDTQDFLMAFVLQHTKGHQTAGDMMQLDPLRAGLTAAQPELIFAHADNFLDLGAHPVQSADLGSWECQAIRGVILGAVSDDQDFHSPYQPTAGVRTIAPLLLLLRV
jgi:hypothetical protein